MTRRVERRLAGRLLATATIIVGLVASWPWTPVARADSDAGGFVPFWVQTYRPTHVWSGIDHAADFGEVVPFSYFRVVTPQAGPRLHVYNPATRNYAYLDAASAGPSGPYLQDLPLRRKVGGNITLRVELAITDEAATYGLMGRTTLADGTGMLFVLPDGLSYAFWMHRTFIPLTIAFMDQAGRILDIQDMRPLSEELHSPGVSYKYALEVNQGWFAGSHIERDDSMTFPSWLPY